MLSIRGFIYLSLKWKPQILLNKYNDITNADFRQYYSFAANVQMLLGTSSRHDFL